MKDFLNFTNDFFSVANDENKVKNQAELPYYSKYLLLAAYFASYNPATTDRRFFTKKSAGRMSKRTKHSIKAAKNLDKKFLGKKFFHPVSLLKMRGMNGRQIGENLSLDIYTLKHDYTVL